MSIKTTHYISTELARDVLKSKIGGLTNDELASMLYDLKESEYKNYIVIDSTAALPRGESDMPIIDTLDEFNEEYELYHGKDEE